jgi:hypothetical protein
MLAETMSTPFIDWNRTSVMTHLLIPHDAAKAHGTWRVSD